MPKDINTDSLFNDYKAWKKETYNIVLDFYKLRSPIIERFGNVMSVVDYFYYVREKRGVLTSSETIFFEEGFEYLASMFEIIRNLLISSYHSDTLMMDRHRNAVLLVLYTEDILRQVYSSDVQWFENNRKLEQIKQEAYEACDNNDEEAINQLYLKLKKYGEMAIEKNEIEYPLIDQLYSIIADTLGINICYTDFELIEYYLKNEPIVNKKKTEKYSSYKNNEKKYEMPEAVWVNKIKKNKKKIDLDEYRLEKKKFFEEENKELQAFLNEPAEK